MSDYADLYVRQWLSQTSPAHAGGAASPDILPWGTAPDADPNALTTPTAWGEDPGVGLVPGAANHIYARTRNAGTSAKVGRMYLGAAPASYLCWPDTLQPLQTGKKQPYVDLKLAADAIGVSPDGFVYTPATPGDTLATWVRTIEHPVTLPTLRDINTLADFITGTPSYAQRSVGFGLSDGQYLHVATYDQRDVASTVVFDVEWSDCPRGWEVSLMPTAGGDLIEIEPFPITMPQGSLLCRQRLPAGFATTLAFKVDAGTTPAHPNTRIDVRMSLVTDGVPSQTIVALGGHSWRPQPWTPSRPHSAVQGATHE